MHGWSSRRTVACVATGALSLVAAGSALAAAAGGAPSHATIRAVGADSFKPNASITTTFRFVAGTVPVRSGGTVTLTNLISGEPHTLSIVKRSDVPRTINQVNNCRICVPIAASHGVNFNGPPPTGPPPVLLVNVAKPGFDQPGDSIFVGPKGHHSTVSFKVTAKPGTTLYFICIVHPWMQGRILVK
jgi:plastocyanin